MTLTLPIYYTEEFKTKPPKVWLLGMNNYRNWHYHLKNKSKVYYHELIANQTLSSPKFEKFSVHYKLYYKNISSDPSNIIALVEKYTLDGLKEAGVIIDDNLKYHISSSWEVIGKDTLDPRVDIEVSAIP